MKDFNGKVAVITGGGSPRGIGRATGTLLAERGTKLVLADLNPETLEATVKDLSGQGADVIGVPTDVANFDSVKNLANEAYSHFGQVDIAFLNAGIGGGGDLFSDDMAGWNNVIGVNYLGVLHGIKAFAQRMIDGGNEGHILATSSGAGATGVMYTGPGYAVTKQAVCTLMECLYGQLRDMGSAIKATVVFPPLTKSNLAGDPAFMEFVAQGLESNGVPAGLAEPEEVAQFVVEAIENDSFWAHGTVEQDARISEGRLKANIEWEHEILRARAEALIARTPPDSYIWGGSGAPRS
jgi:NAD(P)-dependent dehydrogenase (short-subunit alcohol dehydrogenase family)